MGNLNDEPKMWFWILIYIFIQVSDTQIYYSTGNTRYCYNDPDFCALCGCFETNRTEHTLRCGVKEVVRMEFENNPIEFYSYDHDNDTCVMIRDRKDYCNTGIGNVNDKPTYKDRVEVYRQCSLKNTCTITVNQVEEGNVKLVRYPYICENNIQDISRPFSRRQSNPVFYFNGLNFISKTIDCDCSVYKSSGNLEVEIFYLHGHNICNKFDILPNTQLVKCTNLDVQLYTATENIQSSFLKIEIRNLTVTGDEVVFLKVHGEELDVTCTGCITGSEPVCTTSKTTIPTPSSTIPTPLSTTPSPSSPNPSSTLSESTTTSLNSSHGSDQNNEADFISKTEYEEKLNKTNSMFGGIIAAIIIIVLLGIVIYCFIRKRRKFEKVKNEKQQPVLPKGNDGEYGHYVDLDLQNDTDTTIKQPETSKQPKNSGEQSSKSNTSQNPKENENDSVVSPNLYVVIEPDARDESNTTSTTNVLRKPEESKSNELYSVPRKIKSQKPLTQEQNGVNSTPTVASNTDDLIEDTYNHIGEPIVARNRVLSESHIKPIAKLKPIRYNHDPTDGVPISVVTLNQNQTESLINPRVKSNPSADDYSHIVIDKTHKVPKSIQSNYDHIDDRLVIMDSPVDRDDTYSHIQDTSKVKTPQPSPRIQDKLPQSADLSTVDDFYENVDLDQEVKANKSVRATSLYNDEMEDTYNHLETNI